MEGPAPTGLNKAAAIVTQPKAINKQETMDAINFHWKNLSLDLKNFLLSSPSELSLRKFVEYWTAPSRIGNTSPSIAASICGCSWYLALSYMQLGDMPAARALILNGCFLQQCYNKPIEEIANESDRSECNRGRDFRDRLPYFTDGLVAISSEERMSNFLSTKVSSDYQRRMAFATQTTQTKKKVQDYVDQISSDWNEGAGVSQEKINARRRRASVNNEGKDDDEIEILLVDARTKEKARMSYGVNVTLKSLFKQYAEDRGLNLRQLRFSYEGRTLFLSSVGNKTPEDLGMKHLDSIFVANPTSVARDEENNSSSDESFNLSMGISCPSNPKKSRKKHHRMKKGHKRATWAGPEMSMDERLKLVHSLKLGRVHGEASSEFQRIRQRLNALTLECAPKKVKTSRKKPAMIAPLPLKENDTNIQQGGKAGTPFYPVHVGSPENLYSTNTVKALARQRALSIDLHGFTRDEAINELETSLPQWYATAMEGEYPFVIKVTIICGGGNQILSEAVDRWIKTKDVVSKAPRSKFSRRRLTC